MLFRSNIVGYYAGADRIARAVYGLLAPASEAVYPRITRVALRSQTEARRLARLALVLVGAMGLGMAAGIFLLAPYLVHKILGPGFEPAVLLLRIFSILPPAIALRNILGIHWMLPLNLERELNAIVLGGGVLNIVLALLVVPWLGGVGLAWVVVGSQVAAGIATHAVLRRMRLDPLSNALPEDLPEVTEELCAAEEVGK